jgi:Glycosyl transferase family 2
MSTDHTSLLSEHPRTRFGALLRQLIRPHIRQAIAREISSVSRYFDRTLLLRPPHRGEENLLEALDCPRKELANSLADLPSLRAEQDQRSLVLLHGNFNHEFDVQGLLQALKPKLSRTSRVGVVVYNSYYSLLYRWATRIGLRRGELPRTFLTNHSLRGLASLAGFEVVKLRPLAPFPFPGGRLLNRAIQALPLLRLFGLVEFVILRPLVASEQRPSLSVVIPARNEKGNIENALRRMPDFGGAELELIFVEGNSTDDTWAEIQRVAEDFRGKFRIKALKQTGKGKGDAVRLGLAHASGELLTILDADLTMPPELLPRFYDAYLEGRGDFINGNRLVYPMEGDAMRFLNWLGNVFFAKSLSWVLDTELGDSLCGTKLFSRADYARFCAWREDFGDFDPFGDFELLFPACVLGLGVVDLPVRYLARTYGSTNIRRFRHGLMLLRMTLLGFFRIRAG